MLFRSEEENNPIHDDNAHILSFVDSISENKGVITLSGEAFIKGLDVTSIDSTSHNIELFNLETEETIKFEATTGMLKTPEYIGDNHVYQAVLYTSEINLNDIPAGNYVVQIRVTTNGITNSKNLYADSSIIQVEEIKDENTGYITSVYANNLLKNRLEISKEK